MSKKHGKPKRKWKLFVGLGTAAMLAAAAVIFFFVSWGTISGSAPVLAIETPQKISSGQQEDFTLDVTISTMGDAIYPAASMSISFDTSRLEFIGVEEGNVFVTNITGDFSQKLPEWSCNAEQCNKIGKINIMYLDTTGGRNAFSKNLLAEEENVVLRLKFRLRGSVRTGDVLDLIFEDAVLAASDETESLASVSGTLKVKNSKIVIGE